MFFEGSCQVSKFLCISFSFLYVSVRFGLVGKVNHVFRKSYGTQGDGTPLQCSCLENLRDGEAWWAASYGVAQNQTRLKRLSSGSSMELKGFPGGSDGNEFACYAADPGLIPGSGRTSGEGNGNPLQYSCLENSKVNYFLQFLPASF